MEAAAPPVQPVQPAQLNARRIHVSGYPAYTQPQDLSRVFASYGTVKVDKLNNRFAVLTFTSEDEAQEALDDTNKVNIYGEFLTVSPYTGRAEPATQKQPATPKREFVRSKRKGEIIQPKLIALTGDFHTQLDNILNAVRLTQEEVTSLSELYQDLEFVLQQQWPGCMAVPFGSITTGLGIKSSDADCFIQVPAIFRHLGANFVNKAKKLLQQYPHIFAEILAIPRANTPIVKFFHVPTQFNCDVTFKTPLGAQNSKLIAFLLHADPRLIPMAVFIKYWAKVNGFTGTGKLTNYALTMLLIFYLQQPPVSILPSVEWLQRDRANDIIVDDWNTGFMHSHELLPASNNTQSISELLGGFYQYYTTFNFDEMVVCPYTGYPMKKELFRDLKNLPPEFERYKINIVENFTVPLRITTSICVQDPIEQSHNVASAITSRLAAEINAYFKFASTAYEKEKNKQFANFFKTILLQKPKLPRRGCPEFRLVMHPHILQCIANADWKSVVRDVIMQMFEGLCKIPLTKVEEPPKADAKRQKERYTGTIVKAIWKRKQFNKLYTVSKLDFLKKQVRITEEILSADKESFKVDFQLTMTFSAETRTASVIIKLVEGEPSFFIEFGKFFMSSLQNWYIILLKPYFRASKKPQEENSPVANGSKSEDECPCTEHNREDCVGIKAEMFLPGETDESELTIDISNTTIDTKDLNDTINPANTKDFIDTIDPDDTKESNDTKTSTH
ncbi:speckle targeted PIP5K1A-regulated poly(A) polymerase-like isoform X1 [Maniola hyperantus]|uniref:speckle targeted PIP5K1A-regulated poly(A) polymerase-like isoform X1 n=1 Tax=Aphantopus hyperantus TaxID=2795564 RepID=UPI001567E800|nr:speckle targeted PIP5K1A-regulated poly(A) polymerase-like [Maniola hyperantus]